MLLGELRIAMAGSAGARQIRRVSLGFWIARRQHRVYVAVAALAGLLAHRRVHAGRDSVSGFGMAGVAFHLSGLGGVRIGVLIGVAVRAGKASVHTGLKAGGLVVVAGEAFGAFGSARAQDIKRQGEGKRDCGTPFHRAPPYFFSCAPPVEPWGGGSIPSSVKIFGFFSPTANRSWQVAQSLVIVRPSALV